MLFVPRPYSGRLQTTANGLFHLFWRQKYIIAAAILFIVGVYIVVSRTAEDRLKRLPNYANEFLIAEFEKQDKSSFNNKNTSMFDSGLLEETRKRWIIFKHNDSMPLNLADPNLVDPSMGQAAIIRELFKNMTNGFFIECGAYDGEIRSNTLFLERYLNWSGLLIEADPLNFDRVLRKNRRAHLSNTCLSTKKYPMIGSFLLADNIGRLHEPHEIEYVENNADVAHHGIHIKVQCLPLATYVAALNVRRVDYFSLDIEGLEPEILQTIPFDLIDITALSVEFNHNKQSLDYLTDMMDARGYEVVEVVTHPDNLANDVIFVKRGFRNLSE